MELRRTGKQLKKTEIVLLSLFTILLAFFCLLHIRELNQIVVLNDEFGYWSIAASMGGKNWGELIANTPYYNYGYSLLLVPLFHLGLPTYTIYKAAIFLNVIILILGYYASVLCGKKIFPNMDIKVLMFICFLINCYPNVLVQTQVAWTETLLNFLFWLTVLSVLSLAEKPTIWKILCFSLILGYMFIVHQRTIGIVISGIVILISLCISKKISFKQMILALGVLSGILLLHFYTKGELKDWLWASSELSNMNDFKGQVSLIESIFSGFGIKSIFYGLAGRVFYFLVSGGILWYCGFVRILADIFYEIKKNTIKRLGQIQCAEAFIMLSFLSAVAIGVVTVVQGFGRADSVVYGRYIENTVGPVLLIGAGTIFEKKISIKQIVSYIILLIGTGFLTAHMLQLVGNNAFADINSIGIAKFFENKSGRAAIEPAVMCSIALNGIINVFISGTRKIKGLFIAGIIILIYWLNIGSYTYTHTIKYMQVTKTESNESLAELIKKSEVDDVYYVKDNNFDSYCTNPKYLQFWIPDIQVHVVDAKSNEKVASNSIWLYEKGGKNVNELIRDKKILKESNEFYVCTQMDSKIITTLEEKQYSFETPLALSAAESDTWDSNYEGFRSNGEAGRLINNYRVGLSAGTYDVNFNIESIGSKEKKVLGKCFVSKDAGKEILEELVIDRGFLKKNQNQIRISCMDTEDVEINVEVEEGVILEINSISYEKISNQYLVGKDCSQDMQGVITKIENIDPQQINYFSIHEDMEYDFSYLKGLYPELSFTVINTAKLENAENNGYYILERANMDIFEYLDDYDCLMANGNYILLTRKGNGIAGLWKKMGEKGCSEDGFIDIDVLRLNTDGTIYSDNNVFLNQGTYKVIFSSPNVIGDIEFHAGNKIEKIDFDEKSTKYSITISIKDNNQSLSWKVNSDDGEMPEIVIRRISNQYSFALPGEKERVRLNPGKKLSIPLFDNLGMGTYEFTFTMSSGKKISDVESTLYRKVDPVNEVPLNIVDSDEKKTDKITTQIKQYYDVDKSGYQGVKCVIENDGEAPMTLENIQFRTID
ncbi:hypothetical protein [Clostridium sp. C105KSO13]|uniref:hypothetical protein n=1 Tax=Clostridium sp. C105KSO13 TaxID=1776045 RepID=UPI000740789A|nr:hypothetical protein [Clostridium sp. C105KSO13]CUX34452.1 hypothetical protein BN3456_01578 [Clostridium sp. C105KSO13]